MSSNSESYTQRPRSVVFSNSVCLIENRKEKAEGRYPWHLDIHTIKPSSITREIYLLRSLSPGKWEKTYALCATTWTIVSLNSLKKGELGKDTNLLSMVFFVVSWSSSALHGAEFMMALSPQRAESLDCFQASRLSPMMHSLDIIIPDGGRGASASPSNLNLAHDRARAGFQVTSRDFCHRLKRKCLKVMSWDIAKWTAAGCVQNYDDVTQIQAPPRLTADDAKQSETENGCDQAPLFMDPPISIHSF